MGQLNAGKTWTAGDRVTAADMNLQWTAATLNPTTVGTGLASPDGVLFLRGTQLSVCSWTNIQQNMTELSVKGAGNRYTWWSGATGMLFQEGSTPSLIPVQVRNGAANNTLYLNPTGVGILNADPQTELDVTGTARAEKVVARQASPMLCLTDTTEPLSEYYAGFYMVNAALFFGKLQAESGAADAGSGSIVTISVNAPNDSLKIAATTGNVGLGIEPDATTKLSVGGDMEASGDIGAANVAASGAFYAGEDAGLTGTLVVTGTWEGGSSGSRTLTFAGGILTGVT